MVEEITQNQDAHAMEFFEDVKANWRQGDLLKERIENLSAPVLENLIDLLVLELQNRVEEQADTVERIGIVRGEIADLLASEEIDEKLLGNLDNENELLVRNNREMAEYLEELLEIKLFCVRVFLKIEKASS